MTAPRKVVIGDAVQRDPATRQARDEAREYLTRLLKTCAPQCEPLPTLEGLCTQIDNLIAGYRIRLAECAA